MKERNKQSTDQELLQEIRNGLIESFTVLQNRYSRLVYSVVVQQANRSLQESDWFDIAQRVWIKIWIWIGKVPDPTGYNFGAYLRVCAQNETIEALRKLNRIRRIGSESLYEIDAIADPGSEEQRILVEHLLVGLEPRIAAIVRSYYLEEMTLEEISGLPSVNLSVSYVWKLLQQGIDQIREKYREEDPR